MRLSPQTGLRIWTRSAGSVASASSSAHFVADTTSFCADASADVAAKLTMDDFRQVLCASARQLGAAHGTTWGNWAFCDVLGSPRHSRP